MDFRFTPEQEAFRQEVRAFFRQELPAGYVGPAVMGDQEDVDLHRRLKRRLAQRGWLGLAVPREYGGMGAGQVTQTLFLEEYMYHRAVGLDRMGTKLVAPTLLIHGSEEQRASFLPPILRGEVEWCQGYSEPETGSDLASLQTRAVRDGDDFVISGTKIWTSKAGYANWMFLLARTDPEAPRHRGIGFFLCPMDSPGVASTPITNALGVDHFGQVHLDNVRVPARFLVGEENRGWYVAMTLLDFERTMVEWPTLGRRALDDVVQYCRQASRNGRAIGQEPTVRHALANAAVELEVGRLLAYRIAWLQEQGRVPNREASVGKVYNSELLQRTSGTLMRVLGPEGLLDRDEPRAPLQGIVSRLYLGAVSTSILGGTSEVQRNIIAGRGLGLPRG